jgi:DNA-binding beta-propeller fold protein YncE
MDGQFIQPRGLCLGGGKLWVADTQNNRIEVFTPAGAFLSKFGTKGSEPGQMYEPKDVALSPDATTLYVADTSNHRVQGFDLDGNPLFSWGKYGKAEGDFRSPSCVVVSQAGEVWVCDVQNHRIQVFGPGGQFAGKLQPTGQAAFYYPYGLWVAEDGMTVFVSDTYNHRVQVFDIAWQVLAQIGDVGSGIGQWQYPMGMAAGPGGLLYVVDSGNDRVVAMGPGQ